MSHANNNEYETSFEKGEMEGGVSDGMGIARPIKGDDVEGVFHGHGSNREHQNALKNREISRYDELKRKAFGEREITNAGIVLDSFGGAFGEGRKDINKEGRTGKEQKLS